jgi:hypothetical protein
MNNKPGPYLTVPCRLTEGKLGTTDLDREARTTLLVGVFMNVKIATLGLGNLLFVSSGLLGVCQNSLQVSQTAADQKGAPDLNTIIATMEDVQVKNAATMKAYQVTREYKVFHSDDIEPLSTILVLITFTPPTSESYVIQQRSGNPRGEKLVRQILDQETESAKDINHGQIKRPDYKFLFLRNDTFETAAEYVLRIAPVRKRKMLLFGQIWVDANTFRIRRIEGMPSKNPSILIKDIHLTVQYADFHGSWLPVSFDAHARVLFVGIYSISAHNLEKSQLPSAKQ